MALNLDNHGEIKALGAHVQSLDFHDGTNVADIALPSLSGDVTITLPDHNGTLVTSADDQVTAGMLSNGIVDNAHVANGAAIIYSKLDLDGSVDNNDIKSDASIAMTKLNLAITSSQIADQDFELPGGNNVGFVVKDTSNDTNGKFRMRYDGTSSDEKLVFEYDDGSGGGYVEKFAIST